MRNISTIIKKEFMDKILAGEKEIEFKGHTTFWKKRLEPYAKETRIKGQLKDVRIVFLCGRKCYRYVVTAVYYHRVKKPVNIAGMSFKTYYSIHLGCRVG